MDKQQYILEANRQLANTKHLKPIKDVIQKNTQIRTRPIVSHCSTATYNVSLYIHQILGPLLQTPQLFERHVSLSRTNQSNETPDKHTFIHNRH